MSAIPIVTMAVSAVILRPSSKDSYELLLLKRIQEDGGFWAHVSGGIELNETANEAILREIKEETGLVPSEFFYSEYIEQHFQPNKNRILTLPLYLGIVKSSAEVLLNAEHSDYCWCSFSDAIDIAEFYGQRMAYGHIRELVKRPLNERHRVSVTLCK